MKAGTSASVFGTPARVASRPVANNAVSAASEFTHRSIFAQISARRSCDSSPSGLRISKYRNVLSVTYRRMNAPIHSRYGLLRNVVNPENGLAPSRSPRARSDEVTGFPSCFVRSRSSAAIKGTGASSSMALTNSMFRLPMMSLKTVTNSGPTTEPSVAPTAITPKMRFDCSFVYRSDMKVQNTDRWNRLKMLVQT